MTPVERNAARYRWLRADLAASAVPRVWQSNEHAEPTRCLHGADLDAAIDAEMAAEDPQWSITDAGRALIAGTD